MSIKAKDPEYFDNLMRIMLTKVDFDESDTRVDPFSESLSIHYGLSTKTS